VVPAWDTPILHADVDAFYASVEVLRNPELKGKPVIVGGTSSRGVVTSASYEARRFGVTSAMPTSRARRLCPDAVFIPPDFDAYSEYSQQVREVFYSLSPDVEPISLDEAFIDVTRARRMWRAPIEMAEALRREVRRGTGLVVSVGVTPNKFLAKLASSKAKPDGLIWVPPDQILEFLHPLPVSDLWGVGEHTTAVLKRLGLGTIGDVAAVPVATLERALGSLGLHIARLARGKDDRTVMPDAPRRSLGAEETFEEDLIGSLQIGQALLKLSDRVASRLRAKGISGQTITVKVRFSNFATITRSKTLSCEVDSAANVYRVARSLVSGVEGETPGRKRIRLLGISISSLKEWPAHEQLTFETKPRWPDADRAFDRIRRRFGDEALKFGSLLDDLSIR
jgi:DNA polymerase-4